MKNKKNLSSAFASPWAVLVFFFLILVSAYFALFSLTVFFFFLMCMAGFTAIWGRYALKKIEIEVLSADCGDYPGRKIPIRIQLKNQKLLPLVWLNVRLKEGEGCPVRSEDGFCFTFSWIFSGTTLEYPTYFETIHRGVYNLDEVFLESGDGFGLGVFEKRMPLRNPSLFHIYPELRPVKTDYFLKQIYEADAGSRGNYEDLTLLKSIRDYQTTDSFKKINWRIYARRQELRTNVYELIQPKASFFILDLASYQMIDRQALAIADAVTWQKEKLEDMLSFLGSLFVALQEEDMNCGLWLPEQKPYILDVTRFTQSQKRTARSRSIGKELLGSMILPDSLQTGVTPLLSKLAEIDYHGEYAFFNRDELLAKKSALGRIYLLASSPEKVTCKNLLPILSDRNFTLLCNEDGKESYGYPMLKISDLMIHTL